ncbi:MAG: hypothetical protein LQ346_004262 [Caloplaca aetnensis]|nr:MAG: hypothetical protein LQ346_004262 [Caloplaca aetnensis]
MKPSKESRLSSQNNAGVVQKPALYSPPINNNSTSTAVDDVATVVDPTKPRDDGAVDISADSPQTCPEDSEQLSSVTTAATTENEASRMKRGDSDEKQTPDLTSKLKSARDTTLTKPEDEPSKASNDTSTWRGWFVRTKDAAKPELSEPPTTTAQTASNEVEAPIRRRYSDPSATTSHTDEGTLPRSWFGLWATTHSAMAGSADGVAYAAAPGKSKPSSSSGPATPSTEHASVVEHLPVTSTNKSLGWAFWSRGASGGVIDDVKQSNQGELVIAEPCSKTSSSLTPDAAETVSARRPCSMDTLRKAHSSQPSQAETEPDTLPNHTKKQRTTARGDFSQANNISAPQNLLLPSITGTYCSAPRLSLLQSLSRWWQDDGSSKTDRIQLLQNPPRIKRALAIGIHGYFPAPLIRSVLGQPTGTSVRFADGAANAIRTWVSAHGYQCEIEKVALEGEGKILERVDLLWKLLLNWIDNIRRADFVMVACHSQGVPVAIMLIAKLIEFGCIHDARIGVCAMAGVNLGPFIEFKSRWIGGSAGELFEFSQPDSQVSKNYEAALTTTLKFGTRIAYIGSIDDQLVSLENALETTAIREDNFKKVGGEAPSVQNPYILPFALRGVLEEDYVRKELHVETMELLRQFDDWKPSTKALKDVKFRLEGVRSKL